MSTTGDHWLKQYLPALNNNELAETSDNSTKKKEIIDKLAAVLGAEFYQYIENPNDYSGKAGWLIPTGADKAILFLPTDLCNDIGDKLERQISEFFDVRIKYIDEPVQL